MYIYIYICIYIYIYIYIYTPRGALARVGRDDRVRRALSDHINISMP